MPKLKMKQLEAYVNKKVKEALYDKREVFMEIGKQKVESEVYEKYTPDETNPRAYERTGKLKESFVANRIDKGIAIDNTRSENGRDIAEIVEKGHYDSQGYEHVKPGAEYLLPREFMKETKQEIKDRKLHVTELQKGLKEKGINTKR